MKNTHKYWLIYLLIMIWLWVDVSFASNTLSKVSRDDPYQTALDKIPMPIGGYEALMKKIIYPELAYENRIEGNVYMMVYVNEMGVVVNAVILEGLGCGCDEEAIRVVKKTNFIPSTVNGRISKIKFALALSFKIRG